MIKYNLKCQNDHEFESWFSNSEEFEKLNKKKMLDCIFCSSKSISKSIMSPMISNSSSRDINLETLNKEIINEKDKLLKLRKYIENNFDYVSNSIKRTFPVGLDTEVFSFDSLEKAFFYSSDPLHREHVTLYINRKFSELNNGSFKIYNYRAKGNFSFLRWTLDTLEDLKRIRVLMRLSENSYSWLNLISKLIERNYK